MKTLYRVALVAGVIATAVTLTAEASKSRSSQRPNKVAGMWKPVSVQATKNGKTVEPYGPTPDGLLTFGENLHFVEVIVNPAVPRFAASTRQQATGDEAKAAISGSLGLFGTYSVDEQGIFTGNTVSGSTFPNWKGDVRTNAHLTEEVNGDSMTEQFHDGDSSIRIRWRRVR